MNNYCEIQISFYRLLSIIRNWFLEYPSKSDPYKFATNPPDTKGQIGVPAVVDDILHQKRNGFYIECGAFDGESLRYFYKVSAKEPSIKETLLSDIKFGILRKI